MKRGETNRIFPKINLILTTRKATSSWARPVNRKRRPLLESLQASLGIAGPFRHSEIMVYFFKKE